MVVFGCGTFFKGELLAVKVESNSKKNIDEKEPSQKSDGHNFDFSGFQIAFYNCVLHLVKTIPLHWSGKV